MDTPSPPWSIAIAVGGELDMASAPELRIALLAYCAVAEEEPVVVDLRGVTFMDLAGLRPLVEAQRLLESRGRTLRLQDVPHPVARLLRAAGMSHLLTARHTREPGEHPPTSLLSQATRAHPHDATRAGEPLEEGARPG